MTAAMPSRRCRWQARRPRSWAIRQQALSAQVTLTEKGKYRYSLWVKDNSGAISAPASLS